MSPKQTNREPPNKKYSEEQIIQWQNEVLAGSLVQNDMARRLGISPQWVSLLLRSVGGREYRQLKQLQKLISQGKGNLEIAQIMGISRAELRELRTILQHRLKAGKDSSSSGR